MLKNQKKIWAGLLAAAATAVGVFLACSRRGVQGELSQPITRGVIVESVYGIGTVTANRSFQFKSGVVSAINRLLVKEGDHVKKGQTLLELENSVLFRAPFDATVTLLPFKEGEAVFAQSVILNLVDLGDRYVIVSLEQRAALRVRRAQAAKLSFDSIRDQVFDGSVESVYSNNGQFLVRINAPSLPAQILPGMTSDVAIAVSEPREAMLVPVAAIQENGEVYLKRGEAEPLKVLLEIGLADGTMAEVLSGDIKENDRVLMRPQKRE